jgi:hypothetical protein
VRKNDPDHIGWFRKWSGRFRNIGWLKKRTRKGPDRRKVTLSREKNDPEVRKSDPDHIGWFQKRMKSVQKYRMV